MINNHRKTILINATSAKTGGAETVIRTFLETLKKVKDKNFVLFTSLSFKNLPDHIVLVNKKTSGFQTIIFAILGVFFQYKKYNASRIVSFTNLNCILIPSRGITYFHQLKSLEDGHKGIKLKIYDIIVSNFLKKNTFILQSDYTKSLFQTKFKFNPNQVISAWPGFLIPSINTINLKPVYRQNSNLLGLLPIAFNTAHKNIAILEELDDFFEEHCVSVSSPLPKDDEVVKSINSLKAFGLLSRETLFHLYNDADFLLFPSRSETVGLPIFEFLQTGKPAFVFAADYAKNFYVQFHKPSNFILFENVEEFKSLFLRNINVRAKPFDYSKGEWNKIIALF